MLLDLLVRLEEMLAGGRFFVVYVLHIVLRLRDCQLTMWSNSSELTSGVSNLRLIRQGDTEVTLQGIHRLM